jgi:2-oxoglutarate dehydrogenase E2 component (dihydrolipoamide succinyltransferase)
MATDVIVPALGESITEASVGQWLKQPGEAVAADEAIVALETDKVAVEVPSSNCSRPATRSRSAR